MPEPLATLKYNPNFAKPSIPWFEINGTRCPTPANFQWIFPAQLGLNGAGYQRLYPFWGITLIWDYMSVNEYQFLFSVYMGSISGSTTIRLPLTWGNSTIDAPWDNTTYTGTTFRDILYNNVIVDAPIAGNAVDSIAVQNVKMTIRRLPFIAPPNQSPA